MEKTVINKEIDEIVRDEDTNEIRNKIKKIAKDQKKIYGFPRSVTIKGADGKGIQYVTGDFMSGVYIQISNLGGHVLAQDGHPCDVFAKMCKSNYANRNLKDGVTVEFGSLIEAWKDPMAWAYRVTDEKYSTDLVNKDGTLKSKPNKK
jgi:hypothetical protein